MTSLETVLTQIREGIISSYDNYRSRYGSNQHITNGCTFLTYAVRHADTATVKQIAKTCSVNLREQGGATALHLAIYLQKLDVIKHLLEVGTDIKFRDSYDTPLTLAVKQGNLEIIECLIDKGADINDTDIRLNPPIFVAIKQNKLDIVEYFLKKEIGLNQVDGEGSTPLIAAIKNNCNKDLIQLLLKYKINVNATATELTPLGCAAQSGNLEVVKLLVENGASINCVNFGNTPLGIAVKNGHLHVVKFLTENGANTCKFGEGGKSPLVHAIHNEDIAMIDWLLDHGLEYVINCDLILEAIEIGNLEIFKKLNEKDLFINSTDKENDIKQILRKTLECENLEIGRFLFNNKDYKLHFSKTEIVNGINKFLSVNKTEFVKLLLEFNNVINELDVSGDSPLCKAVKIENFNMVKYFIQKGADINKANAEGLTPLVIASANNNFQTFRYLVECGATLPEDDQKNQPQVFRYYRKAKEQNTKEVESLKDFVSNQEEATE